MTNRIYGRQLKVCCTEYERAARGGTCRRHSVLGIRYINVFALGAKVTSGVVFSTRPLTILIWNGLLLTEPTPKPINTVRARLDRTHKPLAKAGRGRPVKFIWPWVHSVCQWFSILQADK